MPDEWDSFVFTHPKASGYHLSAWSRVISRSFGHDTFLLGVRNGAGEVVGGVPLVHMSSKLFGNSLVSLPFLNYGGLLTNDEKAISLLLQSAERLRHEKGSAYVELRHRSEDVPDLPKKTHKVTMVLELEGEPEVQWKKLDPKVRNQVRKAEKSGLTASLGQIDLLEEFYGVFCRNMRDLGTPVYGKKFFRNVLSGFPDTSRIVCVSYQGKTVASGILIWFRDTLEVPWASSNRDFKELCPNNLLYWEAIRFAIRNKFKKFDFGRSTPGGGTFRFKKQWGAEPVQLFWQYIKENHTPMPEVNPSNPKYNRAIDLWQRLPVFLTKLMGPRIARCLP